MSNISVDFSNETHTGLGFCSLMFLLMFNLYEVGFEIFSTTQNKKKDCICNLFFCTRGRGRTGTPVKELVFETSASTDSATRAFGMPAFFLILYIFLNNKLTINIFV